MVSSCCAFVRRCVQTKGSGSPQKPGLAMAALLRPLLDAGVPRIMIFAVLLLAWQANGPDQALLPAGVGVRNEHSRLLRATHGSRRPVTCTWWSSSAGQESCTAPSREPAELQLGMI